MFIFYLTDHCNQANKHGSKTALFADGWDLSNVAVAAR